MPLRVATLLSAEGRAELLARVKRVEPTRLPLWGRMNAGQMLRHLAEAQRMALGELPVKPRGKWIFRTAPVRFLFIRLLEMPKGVPTAPELVSRDEVDFAAERDRLEQAITRFASVPQTGRGPEHPLLGVLSWPEWGRLQWKHIDHHLRQFGV